MLIGYRRIGIYHGRPASIHRSEIDVKLPSSECDVIGPSTASGTSHLLQSIHLTSQAEAFLCEISLLRRCKRSSMIDIFRRIRQLKMGTRGWRPPGSSGPSLAPASTRAETHSRLDRCLLEMFIGRPFILLHRRTKASGQVRRGHDINASMPPAPAPLQSDEECEFLVQDCVAAAREAIGICHAMQEGGLGLARSSYIEYSSCRAGLLVLIAYGICYCTNEYVGVLQKGLQVLREMASASESARSEVSLLETLEASLRRLRGSTQPVQTTTTPSSLIQESYEGFADWYKNRNKAAATGASSTPSALLQSSVSNVTRIGVEDSMSMQNEPQYHSGPFEFDLFGDGTFPTPDYGQYSNAEKEFLDSLPWIQD
ncbi:hypothetical protein LTR78_003820 [Recurvomyces mirabilis]|uniref:Uncharacterized protein n=1 Tax=Recurvomyces mirabilis TaxID=574656 RepID=A0AAE1C3A5_9PEZI|nr:hypothetical protein LTR78_003820 [Recurvomyces mirabilis]KAK5154932.1 hypothetical protein LTS14_006513 [Recurvomyces mirabilis]